MTAWMRDAACAGRGDLFFSAPVGTRPDRPGRRRSQTDSYAAARAICAACPVVSQCRAYALDLARTVQLDGFFAGMDEVERLEAVGKPRAGINHGTAAGYQAHIRRPEPACGACKEAHRVYKLQRRAS